MNHVAMDLSFHSLPQYGSIALPFTGSRAPLVGERSGASGLVSTSDFDAFIGTTPERNENSAAVLGARLSREALAGHNRRAWKAWTRHENGLDGTPGFELEAPFRFRSRLPVIGEAGESSENYASGDDVATSSIYFVRPGIESRARCRLDVDCDANANRVKFAFTENGLETGMEVGRDFVRTTGYVIRTDEKGLRDFIAASLKYYSGVDGELLTGSSDLVLAAGLIFHQQFVREEGGTAPDEWRPYAKELALGADFETAFREGYMERVFVPGDNGSEPDVEIRRLMDLSLEISIRRPADHAELMPLKGNVLMLGARAMAPGTFPGFVDLMARTVGSGPRDVVGSAQFRPR